MAFELHPINLKLKVNWKLSRNEALEKTNYILTHGEFKSEIAPNIRYGENEEVILRNFNEFIHDQNPEGKNWCQSFKNAALNLDLKMKYGDLSSALSMEARPFETSFSLPIMELDLVEDYLKTHNDFHFYKIKIDEQIGLDFIKEVSRYTGKPLRIDANEAFTDLDTYLNFESKLSEFNIQFIEQPFAAKFVDLYKELKPNSKYEIIGDESILAEFDEENFPKMFHGVNVKLMKTGGILRAKEILEKAKKFQMKTMIGCMIETSLGIAEAAHLVSLCDYVDLDGALLISNDPYRDLFEYQMGILAPRF